MIIPAVALTALSACNDSFYGEAGAGIDKGDFGNSTMNNTLIMSGEKSYVSDLTRRFASEVPNTINFAFDSARLDGAARATLARQASWIRQFPEVRFRVFGHTDAVGSTAYNKRLGLRRAQAVVAFFASQGISRKRLEALASFGETRPVIASQGREPRNRRTVTEVSGFVRNHPSVLDGKYAQIVYREYIASAAPASSLSGTTSGSETATAGGE